MEFIILFISGIIGGLIAGALGLGGGIFYIIVLPVIMNWYGIPPAETAPFVVANSLLGIAMASGTSVLSAYKSIKVFIKDSIVIGIPAIIVSLLSTHYIVHSNWFSKEIFNGFVILLMLFILFQMLIKIKTGIKKNMMSPEIPKYQGILSGGVAGFISALSGLGGGIIIIPILQIKFKQSITKAKLISLSIIFSSSSILTIQNFLSQPTARYDHIFQIGYILPIIVIPLILGVVIGGPLGIRWSKKVSDKKLNLLFLLFVILIIIEKSLYFIL